MPRRLQLVEDAPAVDVRGELLRRFRASAARRARLTDGRREVAWANTRAEQLVADLEAGVPVVVPAWELASLRLPNVRQGVGAFYRIERGGRVVEVVPRRDPADPMAITGWDEVR